MGDGRTPVMNVLILTMNALKQVVDHELTNSEFCVWDATEFQRTLLEVRRRDSENSAYDPETFAAMCGYELKFLDHSSAVRFSSRVRNNSVIAPC